MNKWRIVSTLLLLGLLWTGSACIAYNLDRLLTGNALSVRPDIWISGLLTEPQAGKLFLLLAVSSVLLIGWILVSRDFVKYKSGIRNILPGINTPLPAGEGQYGTAHWLDFHSYDRVWTGVQVDAAAPRLQQDIRHATDTEEGKEVPEPKDVRHHIHQNQRRGPRLSAPPSGGVVLGWDKHLKKLYYASSDTHTLVLGATRSGKSRCLVLPSIGLAGLAGESIVAVDIKGELYAYTHPFLEREGYEVITIDFLDPRRSNRYNFLQPCIDAANLGDLPEVVTKAREISTILIADAKNSEPVWTDGARSVMTMAILAVVLENRKHPEFQNLPNVQQFISNMCQPLGKFQKMPLTQYLEELPDGHPVRMAMGIAQIAPTKMRGSFYTQALTALDAFTDPHIHAMTSSTDFDMEATGSKKRVIYLIVPDLPKTYHPLAALFVAQHYQSMIAVANRCGGRLPRRIEFFLDEFGNFVRIPDFDTVLTVGGGRGMRFHLFLQATTQLDEKYGDRLGRTIRANCETWIYLQSDELGTRKELSEKLGQYTTKSTAQSGSSHGAQSASYNLIGRALLTPDEIARINRPYQLVTSRADPAIMYAPDLSKTIFQKLYGTGTPEYNRQLMLSRLQRRVEHTEGKNVFWGIWDSYIQQILADDAAN